MLADVRGQAEVQHTRLSRLLSTAALGGVWQPGESSSSANTCSGVCVLTAESLFATSERRVKTYYQLSYYGLFSLAFRVACLTRRPNVHARVDTQDLSSVTTRRCSRSSTMRRSRSACTTLSTPRCGPRGPCSRARCAQVSARPAHLTHTCVSPCHASLRAPLITRPPSSISKPIVFARVG